MISYNPSGNISTSTQTLTTNYKLSPGTGLAISSGVGFVLLMPVILVTGLGVGLYYAFKK